MNLYHFYYTFVQVLMGPQRKRLLANQVNETVAYHEAGHAIAEFYSKIASSKLHKITILPRGQSLGMVSYKDL